MSRRTDPVEMMWSHACDLMTQADRMHRRFFRLASAAPTQALWEPPVDMFEDGHDVVIVVALPGVAAERVELSSEPGILVVRAERPLPFAGARLAVRQLEIPYGYFERRIALPDAELQIASRELTHGCLVLRLRKVG
jgi:HSP20 family protein